jgi:hypothetical protein
MPTALQVPTFLRTLDEFSFLGVFDRGVPNRERFVFRPTRQVKLSEYIVSLAAKVDSPRPGLPVTFLPIPEYTLWFNHEGMIGPDYWIFVYTGPGERQMTKEAATKEPALVLHWGLENTVLSDPATEPILLHLDGIAAPSISLFSNILQNLHDPMPESDAQNALLERLRALVLKQLEDQAKKK